MNPWRNSASPRDWYSIEQHMQTNTIQIRYILHWLHVCQNSVVILDLFCQYLLYINTYKRISRDGTIETKGIQCDLIFFTIQTLVGSRQIIIIIIIYYKEYRDSHAYNYDIRNPQPFVFGLKGFHFTPVGYIRV